MEKWTHADIRPIERGGEQDIEIEEDKRRKQVIGLVGAPELHRFDPLAFQQKEPGQNHSPQEDDREGSKIFWHRSRLCSRGDGENNSTLGAARACLSLAGTTRSADSRAIIALATAGGQGREEGRECGQMVKRT